MSVYEELQSLSENMVDSLKDLRRTVSKIDDDITEVINELNCAKNSLNDFDSGSGDSVLSDIIAKLENLKKELY